MLRCLRPLLCALALAIPSVAGAATDDAAAFEGLRSVDLRLASVAYRLATSNAALCRRLAPTPGWVIHSLGQYSPETRPVVTSVFGFTTPIAVEAVVPGAPAAVAGVVPNDALVAIDGEPIGAAPPAATATSQGRDAALAQIAATPVARPLTLRLDNRGEQRTVSIPASPGCATTFEMVLDPEMAASADGSIVQIGIGFFTKYDDDAVAVVAAHELAHNILNHRARLDAAKVNRGLLAEIGRNGRLFRQTEDDADLLGMYLLRNAGYDPQLAVRFWEEHGGEVDGGLFRSRTHRSASARARRIADEIARIPADAPLPYLPPILSTRDQPLQ